MSYLVQCHDGAMWRRHVDHIQGTAITRELGDSTSANQDSDEAFMANSSPEVTYNKEATGPYTGGVRGGSTEPPIFVGSN